LKVEKYEKLPIDRRFLASMSLTDIFLSACILETDAFNVYYLVEKCWGKGFLEKVFLKQFGHLFNENAEPNFQAAITRITNNT